MMNVVVQIYNLNAYQQPQSVQKACMQQRMMMEKLGEFAIRKQPCRLQRRSCERPNTAPFPLPLPFDMPLLWMEGLYNLR